MSCIYCHQMFRNIQVIVQDVNWCESHQPKWYPKPTWYVWDKGQYSLCEKTKTKRKSMSSFKIMENSPCIIQTQKFMTRCIDTRAVILPVQYGPTICWGGINYTGRGHFYRHRPCKRQATGGTSSHHLPMWTVQLLIDTHNWRIADNSLHLHYNSTLDLPNLSDNASESLCCNFISLWNNVYSFLRYRNRLTMWIFKQI